LSSGFVTEVGACTRSDGREVSARLDAATPHVRVADASAAASASAPRAAAAASSAVRASAAARRLASTSRSRTAASAADRRRTETRAFGAGAEPSDTERSTGAPSSRSRLLCGLLPVSCRLRDDRRALRDRLRPTHVPEAFVVDAAGSVAYRGAIDDRPTVKPEDPKLAVNYVRNALDRIANGGPVEPSTTRPYGCSVKYDK
jgi:hypothetical protein